MTDSRRPDISDMELLRLILSGHNAPEIAVAAGTTPDQVRVRWRRVLMRRQDPRLADQLGKGQETSS